MDTVNGCQCSTCERLSNPAKAKGEPTRDVTDTMLHSVADRQIALDEGALEVPLPFSEERDAACRKKNQGSNWIQPSTRFAIYLRDDYTCLYCKFRDPYGIGGSWYVPSPTGTVRIGSERYDRIGLSLDHVVPCNRGGSNSPSNLITMCVSCNSAKSDMSRWQLYQYLEQRFDYDWVKEIQRVVRNRIRRSLDRKGGQLAAKAAHAARIEAESGEDPAKWGFGRERGVQDRDVARERTKARQPRANNPTEEERTMREDDMHKFRLPPRIAEMLRNAGYEGYVLVKRTGSDEWSHHDESSCRALLAAHGLRDGERAAP